MLRKTLIGALVLALTPALAIAAPMEMKHEVRTKPVVTHTIKLHKMTHHMKKAEKIRLIQKHRELKKMRAVAHLKKHRTLEHKI